MPRVWMILGLGLVLEPILILISELAIGAFSAILLTIYFAINPISNQEPLIIINQITDFSAVNGAQESLISYLSNPWIVGAFLVFVSGIVPMFEEFLIPAGTWLAGSKNTTPSDGFIMCVLSGTGFALFETLAAGGSLGQGWQMIL